MTDFNVAWSCPYCGRIEAPAAQRSCPECGEKMQRCSRYEWFLADELERQLHSAGLGFVLEEQWPFEDHRGFTWYFDLRVDIYGARSAMPIGYLIEVDGSGHAGQKKYSGPGGGYTRDYDKEYEYNEKTPRDRWLPLMRLSNEQCARRGGAVRLTVAEIVEDLRRKVERRS
jgi:hypothetical protein